MRVALVALLTMLVLGTPGWGIAGPYEDGAAAYGKGEYTAALSLLRPLAEQGDSRAQTLVGKLYMSGGGVPQDFAQAAGWYTKAADQGHSIAQFNFGLLYQAGQGVPKDLAKAAQW